MSIQRLRTIARELAGEAWDYERRQLPAQAYVRRRAAKVLMTQADIIQREDTMFEDPQAAQERQIEHSGAVTLVFCPSQRP